MRCSICKASSIGHVGHLVYVGLCSIFTVRYVGGTENVIYIDVLCKYINVLYNMLLHTA